MEDVISLGVGEPDFVTPWCVCEASIYSIEQGSTAYTSNKGTPQLRGAISRYLDTRFGTRYDPENEIIVTCGVSEAADIAIRAVVDPGDEVLVAEPSYVSYTPCVSLAGGVPVTVPCRAEDEFRLTADALAESITPRTKVLIANFPNNPTGGVMQKADWRAIADLLVDKDLLLISDEVYAELTYDGDHFSPATIPELRGRTITLNGFSKAFAMTGWRIGYLASHNREIVSTVDNLQSHSTSNPASMAQWAAIEAVQTPDSVVQAMASEFDRRRRHILKRLSGIPGLTCVEPEGAFYVFPNFSAFIGKTIRGRRVSGSLELADILLNEAKVAVVPGIAFGSDSHFRLSYATSMENIDKGLDRIADTLKQAR